jgi:ABC-2 type transport system permease protein
MKTTFIDSLQYASNILFKFVGFSIMMYVLASLWKFIYSAGTSIINGYTFSKMIWYLLLAELITFSCGSTVATNEVRDNIKSGNIAYQVNKPYNYIGYVVSKYIADSIIRFIFFFVIIICLGFIFAGRIEGFNYISIIAGIPVYFLAILITGLIKILISLTAFWVEDSKPFQNIYSKLVLIFGVLFPIGMFPSIVQKVIRYSPIYGVSSGPASLVINYSFNSFIEILITQIITIIIVLLIILFMYRKGVKRLNVNGG